ncbi:AAA family ATPase [Paractinoplanes lichenicola]|uniref:AAA family ATPase n=1 Tax=Paractinoplanes lichenicola TaxID=2802976 RepID=A0ABS1VM73_9ACTN|nr:AAA family ATPase [Actinoplanes lichenicola]MBL7255827.1 AAA family ATPase [Actinoplanes lichenicola]
MVFGDPPPRLQILGPLRVWRGGTEVDAGPRQQAFLLALLLARAGGPTGTGELIDLIWEDDAPASALNVIQKYVGSLRRLLEPTLPARADGSYLRRRAGSYVFEADADRLDLLTFRQLVAAAQTDSPAAALDHYAEALALWRGPAGGGLATGTRATTVFAALDEEFYAACATAAALAVSLDRPERLLPPLQLAASMAPFHEPVQSGLVGLLGAAGRQAEALSVFRTVRDRLAGELGISPGAALEAAHLRVLTRQAPVPAAPPSGAPATASPHPDAPSTASPELGIPATASPGLGTPAIASYGPGIPATASPYPGASATASLGLNTPADASPGLGIPATASPRPGTLAPTPPGAGTLTPTQTGPGTPTPTPPGAGTPIPTQPGAGTHTPTQPGPGNPAPGGLVGRDGEFARLWRAVRGAVAGRTAVGVVEGEPGVGKTRLLEATAAAAVEQGALVVWGRCLPGDGTPAMWPWEQALGAVVDSLPAPAREKWRAGDLGSLLEPREHDTTRPAADGNAQFRLFEQVVAVLGQAGGQRPTLLILDDLQWADAASLQLFGHLAARLPRRTALLAALRDRAPEPTSMLARTLAGAGRLPGHVRFRLGPLDAAGVAELIRHELGHEPDGDVVHAVHARTAGNPFFVRELARMLGDGDARVPATVRDIVRDRLAGLDLDGRDLVQVAALIGRDVDLRLLARAVGAEPADCLERIGPLLALGLFEGRPEDPSSLRFAHDLVRESVAGTVSRPEVARLHLRVADALEHLHGDDEAVAHHLWSAGPLADPSRTAEALLRAARRAAAKLAYLAADRHLRHAAQVTRAAGLPELELSVLTLLTIVVRRHADYEGTTFELLERAEHLARILNRPAEADDFLFIRTMGAFTRMTDDRGLLARRMHERGRDSGDPAARAYARQAWGLHQWDIGNIGEAYRSLTGPDIVPTSPSEEPPMSTPLRRDGSIPGEGPGWRAVMTGLHGDPGAALAFVDTWDDPTDPYAFSIWVYYTTMIASMAGDAAVARGAGERWVVTDLDHLRTQLDVYIRQNWCWARAMTGDDPAAAAREAEVGLAADLLDPPQWGLAYHYALIAEMWLAADDPERAGGALDRAERAIRVHGQRYAEGLILLLRARLLQARGEPVAAVRAAAERARDRSADRGAHLFARRAQKLLATLI